MSSIAAIIPIIALAVIAAIISVFLQQSKLPVMAIIAALATGAIIFLRLLPSFSELISLFENIALKSGLNSYYFIVVIKVIGIAYIAEFGAQLCRDAGQGAIALKVEIAAKVAIMLMAMPIASALLQSVLRLLQ